MAILKCGQKDNKNYTFGVRKEQMGDPFQEQPEKKITKNCCVSCGTCLVKKSKFCPACGEKLL